LPLQNPVVPQLAAPPAVHCPAGSAPLAGTGEQVPAAPGSAQDIQVPLHAVPQQIPWSQMVLLHSVPLEQTAPFGLSPQDPALQEAGIAQSASVAQVALQALAPQANGKQEDEAGIPQVPAPSQVPPGVKVVPVVGQVAAWQEVPCWYFSQAPAWHLPSVPQLAAPLSTQLPAGSGPEATAVHCPIVPVMAHERQAPVQAVAQQTPCAQNVDWHSTLFEQKAPIGFSPQEPALQTFPDEQELLSLQLAKQRAPLQTKGAQPKASGTWHFPVASQVECGV
jgi:hypothetical protein